MKCYYENSHSFIAERIESMDADTSSPLERDIVQTKLSIKSVINVSIEFRSFMSPDLLDICFWNNVKPFLFKAIQNYDGPIDELKKLNELGRVQISRLRELIDDLETFVHEQTDDVLKTQLKNSFQSEKEQLQR